MQQHPYSFLVVTPFAGTVAGTHLSTPLQSISSLCTVKGFQKCVRSEMWFVFTGVCVMERALGGIKLSIFSQVRRVLIVTVVFIDV